MNIDKSSAEIRIWPPMVYIGALFAGWMIDRFSWWHLGVPLPHFLERMVAGLAIVIGFGILMTAIGLFKKAGTPAEPWKQVSALVTDGVYRWTRNPMYLGMTLIYLGLAIYIDSLITLLLIVPVTFWITRNVIEKEEAVMTARFGSEYLAYRERVGRWF